VILLCDVIFVLVKPQADAAGVSDEQFAAALGGDAILAAQTAFYEELVDFFRKLGRTDLAKAVDAQRRMIDLRCGGSRRGSTGWTWKRRCRDPERSRRGIDPRAVSEPVRQAQGESKHGESSTSLPPSPASIPAP